MGVVHWGGYCIAGVMDEKTVRGLNAINRSFYRDSSDEFSATRRDPWLGWERIPPLLTERLPGRDLHTLDLGCGNGRFGDFLAGALPSRCGGVHYLGIDASAPLLTALRARSLPFAAVETRCADIVETPLAETLGGRSFALIGLFGLLHHVPGHGRRRELLCELAAHLEPGGLLAITFWRFGEFERFRARRIAWSRFNETAADPIDEEQLEDGDYLLAWGEGGRSFRYCHFADERETSRLIEASGLRVVAHYDDDGRDRNFNRYFILQLGGGS
jgi:SAM-dependent methyltransferase